MALLLVSVDVKHPVEIIDLFHSTSLNVIELKDLEELNCQKHYSITTEKNP